MDRPDTREWLTTNGLGGYASGTACGANTRRYHGLLVAALDPRASGLCCSRPRRDGDRWRRRLRTRRQFLELGATAPQGHDHLKSFTANPVPTWEYQVGLGRLIKRVASLPGRNAVAISYRLEGGPPVRMEIKVLANSRDFHGDTHGHPDWLFKQDQVAARRLAVTAWDGAPEWSFSWDGDAEVEYRPAGQWYWGYSYPEEAARGLSSVEDNYCLGFLGARLAPATASTCSPAPNRWTIGPPPMSLPMNRAVGGAQWWSRPRCPRRPRPRVWWRQPTSSSFGAPQPTARPLSPATTGSVTGAATP